MNITKGAHDPSVCRRSVSFFGRARDGSEAALRRVGRDFPRVLLPSYVGYSPREGSGVLDPVLASGLPYDFYDVDLRFEPVVESVCSLVRGGSPPVVVVAHYFGRRSSETNAILQIVRSAGAYLLEDWAHGLFSHPSSGQVGDAAIYSLHKTLPMRAGGVLVSSEKIAGPRPELSLELLQYDIDAIARLRRSNFELMVNLLRGADLPETLLSLPWTALSGGAVPQSLPVLVPASRKDRLYHELNDSGFGITSLYHTLVSQVRPERHPSAHWLSARVLNLPVHQDMGAAECAELAETFLSLLTSGGAKCQ